ncbi:unnamed protein product [Schistosoma curassoni]|uniref:Uncharacterized protein n=1 Tax=Schistosoma curassoni TaxID=6186 RepID=A0A183KFC0_9TREM|nr:unnamed protein product [Schistosoma curassoni]
MSEYHIQWKQTGALPILIRQYYNQEFHALLRIILFENQQPQGPHLTHHQSQHHILLFYIS